MQSCQPLYVVGEAVRELHCSGAIARVMLMGVKAVRIALGQVNGSADGRAATALRGRADAKGDALS